MTCWTASSFFERFGSDLIKPCRLLGLKKGGCFDCNHKCYCNRWGFETCLNIYHIAVYSNNHSGSLVTCRKYMQKHSQWTSEFIINLWFIDLTSAIKFFCDISHHNQVLSTLFVLVKIVGDPLPLSKSEDEKIK